MTLLRRFIGLVRGLLLELSDQSAYRRHLLASGRTHSAAEWRHFTDRRYRRKYQNAKCC